MFMKPTPTKSLSMDLLNKDVWNGAIFNFHKANDFTKVECVEVNCHLQSDNTTYVIAI